MLWFGCGYLKKRVVSVFVVIILKASYVEFLVAPSTFSRFEKTRVRVQSNSDVSSGELTVWSWGQHLQLMYRARFNSVELRPPVRRRSNDPEFNAHLHTAHANRTLQLTRWDNFNYFPIRIYIIVTVIKHERKKRKEKCLLLLPPPVTPPTCIMPGKIKWSTCWKV